MIGVWSFLALTGFAAIICLGALILHLFDDFTPAPATACWKCHGDGLDYTEPGASCPECKGTGRTVKDSLQVAPATAGRLIRVENDTIGMRAESVVPATAGPVLSDNDLEMYRLNYPEIATPSWPSAKPVARLVDAYTALRAEVELLRVIKDESPAFAAALARADAAEAEVERLTQENAALYVMCKDRNANIEHLEERLARGVLARIFDEGRLIEQRDEAHTEAERLRRELADADEAVKIQRDEIERHVDGRNLIEAWRAAETAEARVATLETAIRNAPHGLNESFVQCKYDVPPHICDCWKRAALEARDER